MLRLVGLIGAVVFLDTMFFSALTPLLPEYADELGLTKAEAGILVAAYPTGVLLAGIPSGILASRIGVKPTLLGGLFLLAGTTVLFGLADAVPGAAARAADPGARQRLRVDGRLHLARTRGAGRAAR